VVESEKMNMKKIDKELGVVQESLQTWPSAFDLGVPFEGPDATAANLEIAGVTPWEADENERSKISKVSRYPAELTNENDIDNDYTYQRDNFYNLVKKGSTAIDGILELAKEGEHPRAYEVAGNLIKQVAEVTEKLGDLQEKMRKLKEVPNHGPRSVTNALFVGSTKELQKLIKGKTKET
jgi:hypothetical protein